MMMNCNFGLRHLVGSLAVMVTAGGLVFSPLTAQKALAQSSIQIIGVGANNILYTSQGGWFNTYGRAVSPASNPPDQVNLNMQFRYAAAGSGAGIKAFLTQTPPSGSPTVPRPIAFGASDVPLTGSEQLMNQVLIKTYSSEKQSIEKRDGKDMQIAGNSNGRRCRWVKGKGLVCDGGPFGTFTL